jgi:hypothetical protein
MWKWMGRWILVLVMIMGHSFGLGFSQVFLSEIRMVPGTKGFGNTVLECYDHIVNKILNV